MTMQLLFSRDGSQLAHDERRLLFLAALLLPLRQLTYEAKPGKEAPASSYVVRESLKWRAKDADGVVAMHSAVGDLAEVLREMQSGAWWYVCVCVCGGGGGGGGAGAHPSQPPQGLGYPAVPFTPLTLPSNIQVYLLLFRLSINK